MPRQKKYPDELLDPVVFLSPVAEECRKCGKTR